MPHVIGHCRQFFAHTLEGVTDTSQWEPLADHLENVSHLAGQFASRFNAADWGTLAGLWHDLGKYSHAFQDYLLKENGLEGHLEQYHGRVDHSTSGAQHAAISIPIWGRLLAYIIAGHHAGLTDAYGLPSSLEQRLKKTVEPIPGAPAEFLDPVTSLGIPSLDFNQEEASIATFQLAFFTRMLFSSLVDADFLATEQFMSPDRAIDRPIESRPFTAMQSILQQHLADKAAAAEAGTVKRCRQDVLTACRAAAELPLGLFSLTVPTGGAKHFLPFPSRLTTPLGLTRVASSMRSPLRALSNRLLVSSVRSSTHSATMSYSSITPTSTRKRNMKVTAPGWLPRIGTPRWSSPPTSGLLISAEY